jgi:DNA-binding transcriptional LysR family regulator
MELTELRIFKAVADHGGVTRAAAALNRVQSNVTTRVKRLEQRLGARLFNRQGRKLVLSAEGKVLLEYAERLLRLSAEAQAAIKAGAPRGVLRIGALESTAATRLPPLLARYHRDHPAVQVELVTGTTGALVQKVLREEIEAAFVAEPPPAPGLETRPAFTEQLVLITPKGQGRVNGARDIGQRTVLAFATGCTYRRRLEAWLARAGMVPQRVMEYGSYHAIIACAAAGGGIALVPRSVLRVSGLKANVAVHTLPAQLAQVRTLLVWRRGERSSAFEALQKALA